MFYFKSIFNFYYIILLGNGSSFDIVTTKSTHTLTFKDKETKRKIQNEILTLTNTLLENSPKDKENRSNYKLVVINGLLQARSKIDNPPKDEAKHKKKTSLLEKWKLDFRSNRKRKRAQTVGHKHGDNTKSEDVHEPTPTRRISMPHSESDSITNALHLDVANAISKGPFSAQTGKRTHPVLTKSHSQFRLSASNIVRGSE